MPRKRNPERDEAKDIWLKSNKTKALKDIAIELGVSASTIRKWKSTDKWDIDTKRSAPIQKERYDSMRHNKNAENNNGGPPKLNKNAVTHGLFAKWLPSETSDILKVVEQQQPADILWQNIQIQYTAILRSQKIMFVKDHDDLSNEIASVGKVDSYAIEYAWDKQATFLSAQSRAMGTLGSLIRQFKNLASDDDLRLKKIQMMDVQVKKIKAETKGIKQQNNPPQVDLPMFVDDIPNDEDGDSNGK